MYNNDKALAYQRLTQAFVNDVHVTSPCKACVPAVPESECSAMTAHVQRWVPNMLAFLFVCFFRIRKMYSWTQAEVGQSACTVNVYFFFVLFCFLLCKSLKMGKEIVNIRITVNDVLSCVSCIAIMVLLEVWLDKKKMPWAAVLFHDLPSPVSWICL